MSWSKAQLALAHMAKSACGWERPQYELLLRNIAGIRELTGRISGNNPSATDDGFVRFMAFAETAGFVDSVHGPGYWQAEAQKQCKRIHFKIRDLARQAIELNLVHTENFLAGFINRQTQKREPGPTDRLEECDTTWSIKVLEGLKAFLFPLARQRGVRLTM